MPLGANVPAPGVLVLGPGLMACGGLMVLLGHAFAAATVHLLLTGL